MDIMSHIGTQLGRVVERIRSGKVMAKSYLDLQSAQAQLLRSEKLASIAQLAAGVVHEINNPIVFVCSDMGTLDGYIKDLVDLHHGYETLEECLTDDTRQDIRRILESIKLEKKRMDLDFIAEDIVNLVRESREVSDRVKKIIEDLKKLFPFRQRRICPVRS